MVFELPEFLRPLERLTQPFPKAAAEEALARWDETCPIFLTTLERVAAEPQSVPPDVMLHLYALYMLAEKREPRAFAPAVRLARYSKLDVVLGDTITEGLPSILASLSGGDMGPIQELIEDEAADEFARGAGVRALGTMLQAGLLSRADVSAYLGELLRDKLQEDATNVGNSAVSLCADFGFTEHEGAIRAAYQRGLVDPFYEALDGAIARLRGGKDESFAHEYQLVTDALADMSWWACFTEEEASVDRMEADHTYGEKEIVAEPAPPAEPHATVRLPPKVGRNEPCPCGSGKKYKKCCLDKA